MNLNITAVDKCQAEMDDVVHHQCLWCGGKRGRCMSVCLHSCSHLLFFFFRHIILVFIASLVLTDDLCPSVALCSWPSAAQADCRATSCLCHPWEVYWSLHPCLRLMCWATACLLQLLLPVMTPDWNVVLYTLTSKLLQSQQPHSQSTLWDNAYQYLLKQPPQQQVYLPLVVLVKIINI